MQYGTVRNHPPRPGPVPALAPFVPRLPGEASGNGMEDLGAPGATPSRAAGPESAGPESAGPESAGPTFAAIDFETANYGRDSACAIGVAVVRDGSLVESVHRLIRPPSRRFAFTWLHGIAWEQVADAPPFGTVWEEIEPLLEGVDFLAAHNAKFDRGVLAACAKRHGLPDPWRRFVCSMGVARRVWNFYPTRLSDVCANLDIPLNHHDARSDAEACARILLAATADGWRPPAGETRTQPAPDRA